MSQNILIDGKPLHLLRVIDLREELKKRGIKATGTKSHLQELLISVCYNIFINCNFHPYQLLIFLFIIIYSSLLLY